MQAVLKGIFESERMKNTQKIKYLFKKLFSLPRVDAGGPVVIVLATGSEGPGFKPGRGRWIFSERKNTEYDFLRKGSKTMGSVS